MHSLLGRKLAARCKAGTRLHAKLSTIQTAPTARDQQRRTATSSAAPGAAPTPQQSTKCPSGFGGSEKQAQGAASRTETGSADLEPQGSRCPFGFGGGGGSADVKTGYWQWSYSRLVGEGPTTNESTETTPEKDAAKDQAAKAFAEAAPFADIPGPPQNRITGSIPHFLYHDGGSKISRYLRKLHDDHGQHTKLVRMALAENNELVCYDPNLFLKIYLAGTPSTTSLGEGLWPLRDYFVSRGRKWNVQLAGAGADWQRARMQVNPHLFDPKIVATYVPAINKAAAQASARIGEVCCSGENGGDNVGGEGPSEPMLLHEFMTYVAFDMFSAFALDKQLRTVNRGLPATAPSGIDDEMRQPPSREDFAFVEDTRAAMHIMGPLVRMPKAFSYFQFKKFGAHLDKAIDRGYALVDEVLARPRGLGEQENVRSSFTGRLAAAGEMSDGEIREAMSSFLVAAVDTTSNTLNWVLVHLANNPAIQARLREEVSRVLKDTENNDFCKKKLSQMPFLKACVRESFRLSPGIQWLERRTARDMVMNGFQVPAGTRIMLNWDVCFQNGSIFSEGSSEGSGAPNGDGEEHPASEFRPERFMPAAIEERKGTFKSVLDNKIVAKPFSFGPRMCPGSRVAETEIYSFVCRVVQDWEFSLKDVPANTPHGNPGPAWESAEIFMTRADPFPRFVFKKREQF